MPVKISQSLVHFVVAFAVIVIIGVSLTLSGLAVTENLRFVHATDQLFQLINLIRSTAGGQKDFAQSVGEDILADLQHTGQILPSTTNPWGGETRATLLAANMMRIESSLPPHECRRMALHFMDYQPADIGLLGIQAQAVPDAPWVAIYPLPPHTRTGNQLEIACGNGQDARLGLILQIR